MRFEFIFVRQDAVRGLTTAASIWVTAAIGTAAGAGLPVIAVAATAAYLFVAIVLQLLSKLLQTSGIAVSVLSVRYSDGRGILRGSVNELATELADLPGVQAVVAEDVNVPDGG